MSTVLKGKSTLVKIPLILAHGQSTNFKPFVAHLTSTQCFELFMGQQNFSEPLSHAFALTLTLANSLRTYNALDPLLLTGLTFLLSALSTNTNGYQGLYILGLNAGSASTLAHQGVLHATLPWRGISSHSSPIQNVYIKKKLIKLNCIQCVWRTILGERTFPFSSSPMCFFFSLKKKRDWLQQKGTLSLSWKCYHACHPSPTCLFPTNGWAPGVSFPLIQPS